MNTDGIIFDMDGTIWNTCREVTDSWNIVMSKYGIGTVYTEDMIKSYMGLTIEAIGERALPQIEDAARRLRILKECTRFENTYILEHGTTLYPGVRETLAALCRKYPLFIVSNCQNGYIEAFLEMFDAGKYIKDYENPDRTGQAKAGNLRIICERYGLKAPVYVGDTRGDLEACKAAGVPFIHAAYGFGCVDVRECAARIERFEDLTALFE